MSETREDLLGPGRIESTPRPPKPPTLGIEVSYGGLGCWRRFDLVKFMQGISEAERAVYWTDDITEWGYDQEWERPLAYLVATDHPEVSFGISGEACIKDDWFEVEIDHVRVFSRNGVPTERDTRRWSEADLELLAAHVPWVLPDKPPSEEDIARIPGPLDSPLF